MNKLKDDINKSFTKTPDVLNRIKENPRFKIPEREKHSIFSFLVNHRYKLSFASLVVVALLIISGINMQNEQVYASTVTIDINPSIEIELDEDDLVIQVVALNDDGETIIERDINYQRMTVEEVVNRLVYQAVDRGYIDVDDLENVVLVHVEGKTEEIRLRVQSLIESKMQQEMNKYSNQVHIISNQSNTLTPSAREALRTEARSLEISVNKLLFIKRIDNLDIADEYSLEDLSKLNMRQLYRVEQYLLRQGN